MIKDITIQAYEYSDLNNTAKNRVINWLDEFPIDYEDENGNIRFRYFCDLSDNDILDHCSCNGYLFNKFGDPIHHLSIIMSNN